MDRRYIPLDNRGLIAVSGDDAHKFLQGLISNDINKLTANDCLYALMLTPQGKVLYDFFIYAIDGRLFLDCNILQIAEIKKKLNTYKLRSKVTIEDVSGQYTVIAVHPNIQNLKTYKDPRNSKLPERMIINTAEGYSKLDASGYTMAGLNYYEKIRIELCIPSDMDMKDSFPLEYLMDKYNAIDYQKGCYVGQEVTARTHYRGVVRKKPYIVSTETGIDLSQYFGQEIISGESTVGIMRTAVENKAMALIRTEDLEKLTAPICVADVTLFVQQDD